MVKYHIHHINTKDIDNRKENLIRISIPIHYNLHRQLRKYRKQYELSKLELIDFINNNFIKFDRTFLFYYV